MARQHHYLRLDTKKYQELEKGTLMFDVRAEQNEFQVGDIVYFEEVVRSTYTGRKFKPLEILYVLNGGKNGIVKSYSVIAWSY